MRIQLKPGLPLVHRGPSTVQIGVDPRHGTVLDGLTEADLDLLHELATGVDDSRLALPTDAGPAQISGLDRILRARILVNLLTDTGVLQRSHSGRAALLRLAGSRPRLAPDAAAWSIVHPDSGDGWELLAERRRAVVELRGGGRTALMLAGSLAAAGVGTVRLLGGNDVVAADVGPGGAAPTDVGDPTAQVAARVVARTVGLPPPAPAPRPAPTTIPTRRGASADPADPADPAGSGASARTPGSARAAGSGTSEPVERADGDPPPDLVVLVERAAADPTRGDRLLAADLPHLSVVVRETSVVIGPLVVPGRSACLRCLDLHRTERDPQWPLVLAQLLAPADRRVPHEETALAQVAAGVTALQVLGHLDGHGAPACVGATLEVELPDGLACRRPWPAHPSCGCCWPPAPPAPIPDRARRRRTTRGSPKAQDGRGGPPTTTMHT